MTNYLNSMEEYSPAKVLSTGTIMQEKPIRIVDASTPKITGEFLGDSMIQEDTPPMYLAPKSVEVKRYRIKK